MSGIQMILQPTCFLQTCAIACFIDDWFLAEFHYTAQQRVVCVLLGMFDLWLPYDSGESAFSFSFFFLNQELLKLTIVYFCHFSEESSEYVYAVLVWPC